MKHLTKILAAFALLTLVGCTSGKNKSGESADDSAAGSAQTEQEEAGAVNSDEAVDVVEKSAETEPSDEGAAADADTNAAAIDSPLVGEEWTVEKVDTNAVTDDAHITVMFGADGNFGGSAACNRMIGTYSLDGETLTITINGLTKRMCPPPVMNQETTVVELLNNVSGFDIAEDGVLTLKTDDGKTVTARR